MITNFCEKAQKIIAVAESIAFDFGHVSVGSEHLFLAFLKIKDSKLRMILASYSITYEKISIYPHSDNAVCHNVIRSIRTECTNSPRP